MDSTALPPPGAEDVLYLLDVSGYVFRAYHALPALSTASGEPSHAVLGFTNMLLRLVKDQRPTRMAVALDPPGPSFRKEMYAEYKANRREAPPDIHQQMKRCFEIVDAYQIPKLVSPGAEADDVIATVVKRALARGLKVVIVASDKDLLQLVGGDVIMYDTMRHKVYGAAEAEQKMGVPPAQIRDLLALQGDSSDNVPGVPSVGPKKAKTLLEQYGDLEGIYAHVEEIKGKLKEKLVEHRDDAFLSQKLVTLRDDVPVEVDFEALGWTGGDSNRLRELFVQLEFVRLLNELEPERAPRAAETFHVAHELQDVRTVATAIREAGTVAMFPAIEGGAYLTGELVGIGLACSSEASWYVPFAHRYLGSPPQPSLTDALDVLSPVLSDARVGKLSDDVKRDEIALGRHGITLGGVAFDTTIASYLLEAGKHSHDLPSVARDELELDLPSYDRVTHKQRGKQEMLSEIAVDEGRDYAAGRAAAIWALSSALGTRIEIGKLQSLMQDLEIPLAHVLAEMERTGIRVDVRLLFQMSRDVKAREDQLEKRCHELAGKEFNVGSPRQLESILFDDLALPVVKRTKTARSTDHDVLEELAQQHDLPAAILEYRMLSKLRSTYLDALPKQVNKQTGRVHTVYNQAVAATGRLSSSDPNLQNIPIRTDVGRRVRDAFVPEAGWRILSADYSQIELRVLAHLAEDPELVEAFRHYDDVHVRTATAIFGVEPGEVSREQRGQAKTVNYAVIYGQSHFALARNLGIERREAMRYIEAFFARYAGVERFMNETIEEARRTGGTKTLLGRKRMLPDMNSKNRSLRAAAERVARNTPIQGSAADIMKLAMVHIHSDMAREELKSRMLLTVHDELVFEAPPDEEAALEKIVRERMERAAELSVPLVVDCGWGNSWGEAH